MTVYEIPNIEHCDVRALGTVGFRIIAHEGWYIHLNDGDEETANNWTREVGLPASADFSIVEIRAADDLPEGAEINGDNDTEVIENV